MIGRERRAVALLVAERVGGHDVPGARGLLEVLGLVDGPDARELSPDPEPSVAESHDRVGHEVVLAERPARPSTAPPGLYLVQETPAAAPVPARGQSAAPRSAGGATVVAPRKRTGRPPTAECGTRSGYQRHRRAGEAACQPCRTATAAYERARQATRPPRERRVAACGTTSGYARHKNAGQTPCEPCHAALLAYHRDRRAKRARS